MIQTECGLLCIISKNSNNYIKDFIERLSKLQHRGRDCFGVSYLDSNLKVLKKKGLVKKELFSDKQLSVNSKCILGHVRYSTSGAKDNETILKNCQPFLSYNKLGKYSIAHNGNIPINIWNKLEKQLNIKFNNLSDTRNIIQLIDKFSQDSWIGILINLIENLERAFCLIIQTETCCYLIKDKYSTRPLSILNANNKIFISSESVVYNDLLNNNNNKIDIGGGEIYMIDYDTMKINKIYDSWNINEKKCVFEYIYFLRDDSVIGDSKVKDFRNNLGNKLGEQLKKNNSQLVEHLTNNIGDVLVCGVPSSGINYGKSISNYFGFNYCQFLKKNSNYPWRTFILENNKKRLKACEKKYIIDGYIKGKILIMLDDSIVRGNTIQYLIEFIRKQEPKEIHFLVGSPPIKHPCNYGVDFPDIEELIVNRMSIEDMRIKFKLDSLIYLELDKLLEIDDKICSICFSS